MLEKNILVSFKEKSPNVKKMFIFERIKTLFYRHFSYILIKISVMFTSHSIKKKEAMSTPIKYTTFWFKLSFASMVYNNENMRNNWTIPAK